MQNIIIGDLKLILIHKITTEEKSHEECTPNRTIVEEYQRQNLEIKIKMTVQEKTNKWSSEGMVE